MSARLVFNLFLLAVAAYFVWAAAGLEPQAKRIPLLIGGLMGALQLWVTVRDLVHPATRPSVEGAQAVQSSETEGEEAPPPDEGRRVAAMCAWMALFLGLFVTVGNVAATLVFIFLFLATGGRLAWWGALAVAGAVTGVVWLLFGVLMRFELYPGLLFGGTLPPL